MTAQKGYYCLIQFCPDPSRLEAVNVGVLLFCPGANFIAARTAKGNKRPRKLVDQLDKASLNAAKRALERRLEVDASRFQTLEDLQQFADSRGNILKLTPPRPIKVFDPGADLEKLFHELVGGQAREKDAKPLAPALEKLFRRLEKEGRAKLDWSLQVPVCGLHLQVPYAYKNGVWNLVKPYRFSSQESQAMGAAIRLAIEGDLLQRHGTDELGEKKLIVIPSFEPSD